MIFAITLQVFLIFSRAPRSGRFSIFFFFLLPMDLYNNLIYRESSKIVS